MARSYRIIPSCLDDNSNSYSPLSWRPLHFLRGFRLWNAGTSDCHISPLSCQSALQSKELVHIQRRLFSWLWFLLVFLLLAKFIFVGAILSLVEVVMVVIEVCMWLLFQRWELSIWLGELAGLAEGSKCQKRTLELLSVWCKSYGNAIYRHRRCDN